MALVWRAAPARLAFAIVSLFLPIVVLLALRDRLSAGFLLIDLIAPPLGRPLTTALADVGEWFSGETASALVSRPVTAAC